MSELDFSTRRERLVALERGARVFVSVVFGAPLVLLSGVLVLYLLFIA